MKGREGFVIFEVEREMKLFSIAMDAQMDFALNSLIISSIKLFEERESNQAVFY
tara:strand:+ start:188 stop:349 length:162 start_codon:yes stop_codon:yes gene_type:complete